MTNHRELPAFWGIKLTSTTQMQDISHRKRLASRLLHPDKNPHANFIMAAWLGEQLRLLNHAAELMEQRISWIQNRQIPAPPSHEFDFPFQELPDAFQFYCLEQLGLDYLICNCSEGMHWNVPPTWDPPRGPTCEVAMAFFQNLLRPRDSSFSLEELLTQACGLDASRFRAPLKIGIVLQKSPRGWEAWLRGGAPARLRGGGRDCHAHPRSTV